jgi:hypothetical protein
LTDIVKGVLGGSWGLVAGWILPAGLAIALFGLLVLPSLGHWSAFMALASASVTEKGWILLIASIAIGLTLSIISTPLYRILEGYTLWPTSWQTKRIDHHRGRRDELRKAVTEDQDKSGNLSLVDALALERFRRYPDVDKQVAPTLLGNAIRRFEYYSYNHYQLDSQICWYQLRAAAPESTAKEVDNARSGVDFFVCLLYMFILLGLSAVAALFAPSPYWLELGIAAGLGGVGAIGSYYAAVKATDAWASSVKAMVDMGRIPLAKALGLDVPAKLAEERDMWQRVNWLLGFAYRPQAAAALDPYRQPPNTNTEDGVRSSPAPLPVASCQPLTGSSSKETPIAVKNDPSNDHS